MAQQANVYAGLQFNFKSLQLGASYGSAQQYQAAAGFVGKNCAVHIQSARQQLLSLSAPSYFHQVSRSVPQSYPIVTVSEVVEVAVTV
jgi:hypothetical protein